MIAVNSEEGEDIHNVNNTYMVAQWNLIWDVEDDKNLVYSMYVVLLVKLWLMTMIFSGPITK